MEVAPSRHVVSKKPFSLALSLARFDIFEAASQHPQSSNVFFPPKSGHNPQPKDPLSSIQYDSIFRGHDENGHLEDSTPLPNVIVPLFITTTETKQELAFFLDHFSSQQQQEDGILSLDKYLYFLDMWNCLHDNFGDTCTTNCTKLDLSEGI